MKLLRSLLLLACLLPVLRADDAAYATWASRFALLQANAPLLSPFPEARHYPFRRFPLTLTGELRFDPARGLSLRYLTPDKVTLIVDDSGLLMRDHRGRERVAPPDHRAQATARALLQLLSFDLPALEQSFDLAGDPAADPWTLQLTPRDPALLETLGTLAVTGHADRVDTIVMTKTPRQYIEITVTSATPRATFSAEDLALHFR